MSINRTKHTHDRISDWQIYIDDLPSRAQCGFLSGLKELVALAKCVGDEDPFKDLPFGSTIFSEARDFERIIQGIDRETFDIILVDKRSELQEYWKLDFSRQKAPPVVQNIKVDHPDIEILLGQHKSHGFVGLEVEPFFHFGGQHVPKYRRRRHNEFRGDFHTESSDGCIVVLPGVAQAKTFADL